MDQSCALPLILGLNALIFGGAGLLLRWQPPKNINPIYGYRTVWAMKSKAHWDFTQKYAARQMILLGLLLALLTLVVYFLPPLGKLLQLISAVSIIIILVILVIARVEAALVKKFPSGKT